MSFHQIRSVRFNNVLAIPELLPGVEEISSAELATSAEAGAVSATSSSIDLVTSGETSTIVGVAASDVGTSAEAQALVVAISDTDSVITAEVESVELAASDTIAATDLEAVFAALAIEESGVGIDSAERIDLSTSDSASVLDAAGLAALPWDADLASALEAGSVALSGLDEGFAVEQGSVLVQAMAVPISDDDDALSSDLEALEALISETEFAVAIEGTALQISAVDSATGVDSAITRKRPKRKPRSVTQSRRPNVTATEREPAMAVTSASPDARVGV